MNEKVMIMSPNGELGPDHHQDLDDDHKDDDDDDDELFTSGFNNAIGSTSSSSSSSSSVCEIEEIGSDEQQQQRLMMMRIKHNNRIPETIKEELFEGNSSVISSTDGHGGSRNIYVAVGKSNSSMDALRWTLKNLFIMANNPAISTAAASSSSTNAFMMIYLIHVFPEIRFIPTPMGKFHKDQASPEQVKKYMNQESEKRREFLQKFLNICSVSKVKVETLLIESDDIAKAVIDLILILNIKKLVLGTTKSSFRKLRKANGIADQILKSASDTCDIKIICDGKEVIIDQSMINDQSPSSRRNSSNDFTDVDQKDDRDEGSLSPCTCFTSKFI